MQSFFLRRGSEALVDGRLAGRDVRPFHPLPVLLQSHRASECRRPRLCHSVNLATHMIFLVDHHAEGRPPTDVTAVIDPLLTEDKALATDIETPSQER